MSLDSQSSQYDTDGALRASIYQDFKDSRHLLEVAVLTEKDPVIRQRFQTVLAGLISSQKKDSSEG